ncbi:uncharacterized protein LOC125775198 isoform X1 [Anopheles funestus]|uniref:uncharacterized protein LOC125775198 isoform X1 n=1 Tax=Anopheles funestus TaxID=62324 RepID=UPI0007D56653|nr:uncharacterized protein LOC125775198 isoform X1 [Anopheles funestus]
MRFWFVLLLGALLSAQCISTGDPYTELEVCSVSLFSLIMTRLQQQIEDYSACQQSSPGGSNYNCSETIYWTSVDLQNGLRNYTDCTKNLR